MALEFVYRAENRCKSGGAPAGAVPKPSRGRVGTGSGPKSTMSGPTPPEKPKNPFDCTGAYQSKTLRLCQVYIKTILKPS